MCCSVFTSAELIDLTGHMENMVENISSAARIHLLKKILNLREVMLYIHFKEITFKISAWVMISLCVFI